MSVLIKYQVVREQPDGRRGKRIKTLYMWSYEEQLEVGGLYALSRDGFPGLHRVLSREETGCTAEDG